MIDHTLNLSTSLASKLCGTRLLSFTDNEYLADTFCDASDVKVKLKFPYRFVCELSVPPSGGVAYTQERQSTLDQSHVNE